MAPKHEVICCLRSQKWKSEQHLKYVPERHGPVGDTVDEQCLQNPLDVVEGVTHAGQTAAEHTRTNTHVLFLHVCVFVCV